MKLRIKSLFMIAALLLLSSGCNSETTPVGEDDITQDSAPESGEDPDSLTEDGDRNIQKEKIMDRRAALVTDGSSAMDNGFGQAALKGVKTYADAACVPYSCYTAAEDTPDSYRDTILAAIEENAELVVCVGPHFEEAVGSLQGEYDDIYFLLLGGVPKDAAGEEITIAPNVHCVIYKEEEAGYLVGYMSVLEGYRKFGFIGGEEISSVQKYGYGYLRELMLPLTLWRSAMKFRWNIGMQILLLRVRMWKRCLRSGTSRAQKLFLSAAVCCISQYCLRHSPMAVC